MAAPILPNHRRDRREVRRILAQLVVHGRDLTGSISFGDFDLSDHQHRIAVNDNRQDFAVTAQVQR